ncbi:hypothetical protein Acr_17g0000820 [Actinidia rufa]|uniref:Uncharacterized protein n=1 Tax=Actinidia rufa TaxID=165716 RepID=A0A7J0G137_9ERIC|nr:hypothetical protein Acr_17g0000820 [Actinidia rufa]
MRRKPTALREEEGGHGGGSVSRKPTALREKEGGHGGGSALTAEGIREGLINVGQFDVEDGWL